MQCYATDAHAERRLMQVCAASFPPVGYAPVLLSVLVTPSAALVGARLERLFMFYPPNVSHPLDTRKASASAAMTSLRLAPLPPASIARIVRTLMPDAAERYRSDHPLSARVRRSRSAWPGPRSGQETCVGGFSFGRANTGRTLPDFIVAKSGIKCLGFHVQLPTAIKIIVRSSFTSWQPHQHHGGNHEPKTDHDRCHAGFVRRESPPHRRTDSPLCRSTSHRRARPAWPPSS